MSSERLGALLFIIKLVLYRPKKAKNCARSHPYGWLRSFPSLRVAALVPILTGGCARSHPYTTFATLTSFQSGHSRPPSSQVTHGHPPVRSLTATLQSGHSLFFAFFGLYNI